MRDMNAVIGSHDLLFLTLDTLRYDVAAQLASAGRTPTFARVLPDGRWEERHSPGSFTYAAHAAFFAGFLPTPAAPGNHPRPFAARFDGSETTAQHTWVFDAPDLMSALSKVGYRTVCVGGVGFFNKRNALGRALPGLFDESYWSEELGVTSPTSFEAQVGVVEQIVARVPREELLFVFLNASALHQPNRHYVPGATADSVQTHAAALEYVDRHVGRLFGVMSERRPCFTIACSDHGTLYGESGHVGHRFAHELVWTVPYAEFILEPGQWAR